MKDSKTHDSGPEFWAPASAERISVALGFCKGSSGGPVTGSNSRNVGEKEQRKISESEARSVMKRECPNVEGKRKRKGIPAASQQGKSPGLGCCPSCH